jgi:hypothetical protein
VESVSAQYSDSPVPASRTHIHMDCCGLVAGSFPVSFLPTDFLVEAEFWLPRLFSDAQMHVRVFFHIFLRNQQSSENNQSICQADAYRALQDSGKIYKGHKTN